MSTQITCPTCAAVIDVSELMKEQLGQIEDYVNKCCSEKNGVSLVLHKSDYDKMFEQEQELVVHSSPTAAETSDQLSIKSTSSSQKNKSLRTKKAAVF